MPSYSITEHAWAARGRNFDDTFGVGNAEETEHRAFTARILEEVMDYRTYCETMAGLLRKPIVKLLRNLKVSRNVKWIYQEGISI